MIRGSTWSNASQKCAADDRRGKTNSIQFSFVCKAQLHKLCCLTGIPTLTVESNRQQATLFPGCPLSRDIHCLVLSIEVNLYVQEKKRDWKRRTWAGEVPLMDRQAVGVTRTVQIEQSSNDVIGSSVVLLSVTRVRGQTDTETSSEVFYHLTFLQKLLPVYQRRGGGLVSVNELVRVVVYYTGKVGDKGAVCSISPASSSKGSLRSHWGSF